MNALRSALMMRRWLAPAIIALALAMKLLLPAGYMLSAPGAKQLVVTLCSGIGQDSTTITIPLEADAKGDHGKGGQSSDSCPYGALGHAALGGADGLLLAIAIAFILALGFAPVVLPWLQRPTGLHPPLRGPPLTA